MIKIGEKGEKMSIRKGLTLLLLAAFGLSTVAPALAININSGVTFQTIAQDDGSATAGAKKDVVVTDILFDLNNAGDIFLATDGTDIQTTNTTDAASFSSAGVLSVDTGDATFPAPAITMFVPPTGCSFVRLPGYTDVTVANSFDLDTGDDGLDNEFINVSVTNASNLPSGATSPSYVVAQVLNAAPDNAGGDAITNDATAATFTNGGILALHAYTGADSATQNSALVRVTTQNIGLACDASSAAAVTGDINVTVLQPNLNSYVPALPNLTNGTTFKVAEFGDNVGKLEALIAGQTTGNVTGTAEDSQVSTLISNTALQSVTTVNFGPTEETRVSGTSAFLDIDAILVRAAEQPNSSSTANLFYQTPFATAKFVSDKVLSTDSVELMDADLSNSTLFDNETSALITVDIEITAFDGSASSATLAVTNAFVGLDTPDTISSSDGTGSLNGFLGATAFSVIADSAVISNTDDAAIIAVDPGEATDFVVDGIALDGGLLTQGLGFAEGTGAAPLQTNVVGADFDSVAPTATTVSFTSQNTDAAFLFPGIRVDNFMNVGDGEDVEVTIENVADDNGTTIQFTTSNDVQQTSAGDEYRNSRSTFTNLLPAVASTTGAQYHIVFGDDIIATVNTAKANVQLAATNFSEETNYHQGVDVLDTGTDTNMEDNVILASKLTDVGTGKKFTVHILPFVNRYDGIRDVISVRPKGTITLSSAALTEGVKLLAKVSGNNLPSATTELTLASIVPAGSVTSGITSRILPVTGDQSAGYNLLAHQTGDVTLSRAAVNPALVTGATTLVDELSDIVGSGKELDTVVPPLFAGGIAGNGSSGAAARGPIAFVQPKARALEIAEATDGDFKEINDLGSDARVRITLPVGTDINLYGGLGTNADFDDILDIFGTDGFTDNSLTVGEYITNVQRVTSNVTQAFIEINVPTVETTTLTMLRRLFLVFRPDALVVPEGQTDLDVTISIVDTAGTDNSFTDDTVLATVGTTSLGSLAQFLELSFEQQATSAFNSTTPTPADEARVRSLLETKYGAQATAFPSTISQIVRFVNNDGTPDTNRLWDLKIREGVADAFPIGTNLDGVPDAYLNGAAGEVLATEKQIHCAASDNLIFVGVDNTTTGGTNSDVLFSDSSLDTGEATNRVQEVQGTDNGFIIPLVAGSLSGAPRAADVQTTITVRGIRHVQPGSTPPSADTDIACWFEVDTDASDTGNNGDQGTVVAIGTSIPVAYSQDATAATEYGGVPTTLAATANLLADLRFGAAAPNATVVDLDTANHLSNAVFNTNFVSSNDFIDNAMTFVVDDNSSNLKLLDSNTPISVTTGSLPQVNGVDVTNGDVAATVSAVAGTLEPGTLLNISTSSPNTESVRVPVLADGSFTAVLRTAPTAQLTITQTPSTANTTANIQLKTLNVSDAGTTPDPTDDPAFDGTVPTLLTSSLVEGQIVVLFDAPATTNFTFADVESTATVNGVAVTKLGDKFAAVVTTTGTYTLAVTVDGETVSTTLDVTTTEKSKKGSLKNLKALKTDKNGRYVLKQRSGKLPNDLDLEIVYSDGTTAVVANADLSRNRLGVVKFDNPESDKTISYVQLLSAKKGSRVAQ